MLDFEDSAKRFAKNALFVTFVTFLRCWDIGFYKTDFVFSQMLFCKCAFFVIPEKICEKINFLNLLILWVLCICSAVKFPVSAFQNGAFAKKIDILATMYQ